jgi:hypothetical protein
MFLRGNHKMRINIYLLLSLFALGACGTMPSPKASVSGSHVRLVKLDKAPEKISPESIKVESIEVYYKKEITKKHVDVGIVEAVAKGSTAGVDDLLPELQRQAAMLGAMAIKQIEIQRYDHAGPAIHATAVAVSF